MKKVLTLFSSLALVFTLALTFAACGDDGGNGKNDEGDNPVISLVTNPDDFDGEEMTGFTDITLPVEGQTLTIDFDETVVDGDWLLMLYLKSPEGTFDDDEITADITVKVGQTEYPLTASGGIASGTVTISGETAMTLTTDLTEVRNGGIILIDPGIL